MPKKISESALKKSPKSKLTKKTPVKKSSTQKRTSRTTTSTPTTTTIEPGLLPEVNYTPNNSEENRKFVSIPGYDADEMRKIKTTRIIVGILTLALIGFWGFNIKTSFKEPANSNSSFAELSQKTNNTIEQLRRTLDMSDANAAASTTETDMQKVKNEVLQKLQASIDSSNWPNHTSESLRLTINFPPDWSKKEDSTGLILATASSTNPTSRIKITKTANTRNLSLADWLKKNPTIISGYVVADEPTVIGNQPALKYTLDPKNNTTLRSLIFTIVNKNIYQIDVLNSEPLNQVILDNIISSIKFN